MVGRNYYQLIFLVALLLLPGCKTDQEKLSEYGLIERLNSEDCNLSANYANDRKGKYKIIVVNGKFINKQDEVVVLLGDTHLQITGQSVQFTLDANARRDFMPILYLKRNGHCYGKFSKVRYKLTPEFKCYTLDLADIDLHISYANCN